jgi:hypothetical protein
MDTERPALQRTGVEQIGSDDFAAGEVLLDGARAWLTRLRAYAGVAFLIHLPLF